MPQPPEFEEKEFENAANTELAWNQAHVFSPGQVAEAILGYDAAVELPPGATADVVRRLIGARPSLGAKLTPNFWSGCRDAPPQTSLPKRYVSLLLQYKRADYVVELRARQRRHWAQAYFRWSTRPKQHRVLLKLERNLGSRAAVRYAAPAFIARAILETKQVQRQVLASTNFVSPGRIGDHRNWTYITAAGPGFANPRGEEIDSEDYGSLIGNAFADVPSVPLSTHLAELVDASLPRTHRPRPHRHLPLWADEYELSVDALDELTAVVTLGHTFSARGLSWWILHA